MKKDHKKFANVGEYTHDEIDDFINSAGDASGLATLNGSSLVVQNPANATATPTANKIVMADGSGKLDYDWLDKDWFAQNVADNTNITCGNTTNETIIGSVVIPANSLGPNGLYRLTLIGPFLCNVFTSETITLKLKYGSTTIANNGGFTPYHSSTTFGFKIEAFLSGQGATNSQFGFLQGNDVFTTTGSYNPGLQGTASEDSTTQLNLFITAQWSKASANLTLTTKHLILEKLA